MRCVTGTNSGVPGLVTRATNAMMACFGPVSFQDGSGSCAAAGRATRLDDPRITNASEVANRRLVFMFDPGAGLLINFYSRQPPPRMPARGSVGLDRIVQEHVRDDRIDRRLRILHHGVGDLALRDSFPYQLLLGGIDDVDVRGALLVAHRFDIRP